LKEKDTNIYTEENFNNLLSSHLSHFLYTTFSLTLLSRMGYRNHSLTNLLRYLYYHGCVIAVTV